ncbi:hypothetical protein BDW71DRAFT_42194 [Aspergillus fruticulosus]
MDGLSSAASVIAAIQLTGSVLTMCSVYIHEVKNARGEIIILQQTVAGLEGTLQKLKDFLQGHHDTGLISSSSLAENITDCLSDLGALEKKIDPGSGRELMRKFGLRAWKWPLKRTEVDRIIQNLERYKSSFTLSLSIDQTALITRVSQTSDQIDLNMDLNKLPVAHGAEFNSSANQYESDCLPGTREELLHEILEWARLPQEKYIFWLNGRAGTGKSTISRTVAKAFNEANLLGASFFFKRGEGDRGNTSKFFPTIARQLARRIPQLVPGIRKTIQDDPDIATKGLKEQFDRTLLQPLMELDSSTLLIPLLVVVIDALDECGVDNDMRLILQLLPHLQKSKSIRFRIFIASRPELPIWLGFSKIAAHGYDLDQAPAHVIENDILLFLQHRLSETRAERSLPADWPKDADIHALVELSSPLFIFAATACCLLEDPHWDPVESLTEILTYRERGVNLDEMYLSVLNRLLNGQSEKQKKRLICELQEVIGTIAILQSSLSVKSLSSLTGLPESLIHMRLNPLRSLLNVPDDKSLPVQRFHLSFCDFLLDPENSKLNPFWVDEKEMHQKLTTRCLLICEGLKKNLCRLQNEGTRRTELDCQVINCYFPPELQYSCRYWAHHLMRSKELGAVMHDAYVFLQKHLLHWMEAMSILGLASEALDSIGLLQSAKNQS